MATKKKWLGMAALALLFGLLLNACEDDYTYSYTPSTPSSPSTPSTPSTPSRDERTMTLRGQGPYSGIYGYILVSGTNETVYVSGDLSGTLRYAGSQIGPIYLSDSSISITYSPASLVSCQGTFGSYVFYDR